jgi:hypothetical protein
VLDDPDPRCRRDKGHGGGNVKRAEAVAAGAHDIQQLVVSQFGLDLRLEGAAAQFGCERDDFLERFAFARELAEEIRLDGRLHLLVHQLFDRKAHLRGRQVPAAGHL